MNPDRIDGLMRHGESIDGVYIEAAHEQKKGYHVRTRTQYWKAGSLDVMNMAFDALEMSFLRQVDPAEVVRRVKDRDRAERPTIEKLGGSWIHAAQRHNFIVRTAAKEAEYGKID